jgi:predicted hydrocarbon binding protein
MMIAMKKAIYPSNHRNSVERTIFNASMEVLGQDSILPIFEQADLSYLIEANPDRPRNLSFDLSGLGRMQACLEDAYGPRSGRGLALRTGRALFRHILREFRPSLEHMDIKFRLLPLDEKMRLGADFIARTLNTQLGDRVKVEASESQLRWSIRECPLCQGRETHSPSCQLFVGFLQEAYYWISGGKQFLIEETDCIARGDATCTFVVFTQAIR